MLPYLFLEKLVAVRESHFYSSFSPECDFSLLPLPPCKNTHPTELLMGNEVGVAADNAAASPVAAVPVPPCSASFRGVELAEGAETMTVML